MAAKERKFLYDPHHLIIFNLRKCIADFIPHGGCLQDDFGSLFGRTRRKTSRGGMLKNGFTFCIIIHYLRPASVVIPLWLLFPLGEMPMYKGFQPFWIGDWLENNGEGWERRVKDWLYPYPQCSCVCDKNRRGDCWMTAVSDLPGWRFWGCPNTALVLCSALWNVYSAMRNVYSPLRNVHSALRNINRMPVLAKLEQDEWILLNSYAACICIPVGVGRGPVVNWIVTYIGFLCKKTIKVTFGRLRQFCGNFFAPNLRIIRTFWCYLR